MEELKQEAAELGLDFAGNISKVKLQAMVDEAKSQTAGDSPKQTSDFRKDLVKVVINPRDPEEIEGYTGLNGFDWQFKFDEEIELPRMVVENLRGKGSPVVSQDGKTKWVSRYIIETK